jgi:hypothetical protein
MMKSTFTGWLVGVCSVARLSAPARYHEPMGLPLKRCLTSGGAAVFGLLGALALAQTPAGAIYTCIDDQGRPITRDRYIAECSHKEQRILNRDGSLREVLPPTLTADERARREAAERAIRDEREARRDAIKYDRLLLLRYPDKATHDRVRESALEPSGHAIDAARNRMKELEVERRHYDDEAEFYRGRRLPPMLRQQIESNEVAKGAQLTAIHNAQAEQDRINANFDAELERLRKLWSGAPPGSLGPPLQ